MKTVNSIVFVHADEKRSGGMEQYFNDWRMPQEQFLQVSLIFSLFSTYHFNATLFSVYWLRCWDWWLKNKVYHSRFNAQWAFVCFFNKKVAVPYRINETKQNKIRFALDSIRSYRYQNRFHVDRTIQIFFLFFFKGHIRWIRRYCFVVLIEIVTKKVLFFIWLVKTLCYSPLWPLQHVWKIRLNPFYCQSTEFVWFFPSFVLLISIRLRFIEFRNKWNQTNWSSKYLEFFFIRKSQFYSKQLT